MEMQQQFQSRRRTVRVSKVLYMGLLAANMEAYVGIQLVACMYTRYLLPSMDFWPAYLDIACPHYLITRNTSNYPRYTFRPAISVTCYYK